MRQIVIRTLFVLAFLNNNSFAIVNGYHSSYIVDAYDSTVQIQFKGMSFSNSDGVYSLKNEPTSCTGSIIDDTTVLTAAHCVSGLSKHSLVEIYAIGENREGKRMSIRMGSYQYNAGFKTQMDKVSLRYQWLEEKLINFLNGSYSAEEAKQFFVEHYQYIIANEQALATEVVPYDLAILKVLNPGSNKENFKTFQKASIAKITPTTGSLATLVGFGQINNRMALKNSPYESKIRIGKNELNRVNDSYLEIIGVNQENDGLNWQKFIDGIGNFDWIEFNSDWNSSASWGDSGGPLALHGTYGKQIIGVASMLAQKDVIQTVFIPTHHAQSTLYVNLNGSEAQKFLKRQGIIK
jgi:secreted trypsin-like serine protease